MVHKPDQIGALYIVRGGDRKFHVIQNRSSSHGVVVWTESKYIGPGYVWSYGTGATYEYRRISEEELLMLKIGGCDEILA